MENNWSSIPKKLVTVGAMSVLATMKSRRVEPELRAPGEISLPQTTTGRKLFFCLSCSVAGEEGNNNTRSCSISAPLSICPAIWSISFKQRSFSALCKSVKAGKDFSQRARSDNSRMIRSASDLTSAKHSSK